MSSWLCSSVAAATLVLGLSARALAGSGAPLSDAAERQDWTRVRTLLRQHASVNAPQSDGMTALHWAAYYDDVATVRLLLELARLRAVAIDTVSLPSRSRARTATPRSPKRCSVLEPMRT